MSAILALGLLVIAGLSTAFAQQATPVPDVQVDLMFVQTFGRSTLTPSAGAPSTLTLTLEQGTGETLFFSDRPERIVGSVGTEWFIERFRQETAQDPANAALVVRVSETEEIVHVVELLTMDYDSGSGAVTYTVRLLDDPGGLDFRFRGEPQQSVTDEVSYGTSNLFIDSGGMMQLVAYGAQNVYEVED